MEPTKECVFLDFISKPRHELVLQGNYLVREKTQHVLVE